MHHIKNITFTDIINYIKANDLATTYEINAALNCSFYKHFKSLDDAYRIAGVHYFSRSLKRAERKRRDVINYIKTHPHATQRDVNSACKTKVQEIFADGICEAFKQADIQYDFSRRNTHGAALNTIRMSALNLELQVTNILIKEFGKSAVLRQLRVNSGIIDILLVWNDSRIVIEVKDYKCKPVGISEIRKVENYVADTNAKAGIIITTKNLNKSDNIRNVKIFEFRDLNNFLSHLKMICSQKEI